MARARNIKPGLYKNEDLAECSIWARFIFPGLWMLADREGRLEDRPKRIKAELLPFDSQSVEPLLSELADKGFIYRYDADGVAAIQILGFLKHQSPHYSEKPSVIKPPENLEASEKQVVLKVGPQPPDSLNPDLLNPDSLIPEETTPSGKPDLKTPAIEILQFLNLKTGRSYRPVPANLDLIMARLKDGATPDELRQVVAKKCREWATDEKMAEYLRPATLFNRTKFAQYQGELGVNQ
jgi:uncharacterized phage protein (TIGR02220 family)